MIGAVTLTVTVTVLVRRDDASSGADADGKLREWQHGRI